MLLLLPLSLRSARYLSGKFVLLILSLLHFVFVLLLFFFYNPVLVVNIVYMDRWFLSFWHVRLLLVS